MSEEPKSEQVQMSDREAGHIVSPAAEAERLEAALEAVDLSGDGDPGEAAAEAKPEKSEAKKEKQTAEGDDAKAEPKDKDEEKAKAETSGKEEEEGGEEAAPLAKNWEAIKKREKRLRDQAEELKAEKKEYEAKLAQAEQLRESVQNMQADLIKDPMGFLQKHAGLTFDDLAQRVLNDGAAGHGETVRRAKSEVDEKTKSLEDKIAKLEERLQKEDEERRFNELRSQYRSGLEEELAKDKYEILHALGDPVDAAFALAQKHAADSAAIGEEKVLTAQEVAERLLEETREGLSKLKSHRAVLEFFGASAEPSDTPKSAAKAKSPHSDTTLTNSLDAVPPPRSSRPWHEMSDDDRIAEAMKLVES